MERRFEGKLVAVTGGRSGIGAACIERFAAEGADCHALDISDAEHPVDVTDEAAVDEWFDALPDAPSVVVNAAGTGGMVRIVDCSFKEWRRVTGLNLDGTFLSLRAAARRMVAAGQGGAIINVASINQDWAVTGFSHYCASKAGVKMLTKVAALELGPHGITVNAIAPGPVTTPLSTTLHTIPGAKDEVADRTPLEHRWGEPAEQAAVVAFLASDDGHWITGRSITVDGGHSLVGEPDFLLLAEKQR
jgi:NAD(P)-dependent dehydrogenase (short-subunit alcohol dehydrogenase family)